MPTIEIPQKLFDAFTRRAVEKGFGSATAYLQWVLGEIADRLDAGGAHGDQKKSYTPEEEEIIKDRLRSLGYID